MMRKMTYEKWLELKEYRDFLVREVHNDTSDAVCERIWLALEEYPEFEERYYNEDEKISCRI